MASSATLSRLSPPEPNPETLPFESPSNKKNKAASLSRQPQLSSSSAATDPLTAAAAAAAASAGRPEIEQRLLRHGRVFEQFGNLSFDGNSKQRATLQRARSDSFKVSVLSQRERRAEAPSTGLHWASPRFTNIFDEESAESRGCVGDSSEEGEKSEEDGEEQEDDDGEEEDSAFSESPQGSGKSRFQTSLKQAFVDHRAMQENIGYGRSPHESLPRNPGSKSGESPPRLLNSRHSSFAAAVLAEDRRLRGAFGVSEESRSALPRLLRAKREARGSASKGCFPESASEEESSPNESDATSYEDSSCYSSSSRSEAESPCGASRPPARQFFAQRSLREVAMRRQVAMEKHMEKQQREVEARRRPQSPRREGQEGKTVSSVPLSSRSSSSRRLPKLTRVKDAAPSASESGRDIWERAASLSRDKRRVASVSSRPDSTTPPPSQAFIAHSASPSPAQFYGGFPPSPSPLHPHPLAFIGWHHPHLYTAAAAAFAAASARTSRESSSSSSSDQGAKLVEANSEAKDTLLTAEEKSIVRRQQEMETAGRIQELEKKLSEAQEDLRRERENASELRRGREELEKKLKEKETALETQRSELDSVREEVKRETACKEAAQSRVASLQQELQSLSSVHADFKQLLKAEKEELAKQKAELEVSVLKLEFRKTKVKDLSEDLDFAKSQLLVARESVIAARQKQQAATQAHEEDLKALKAYRKANEALRQDLQFLETLNSSLAEKAQRLMNDSKTSHRRDSEGEAMHARDHMSDHLSPKARLALRQNRGVDTPSSPVSLSSEAGASTRSAVYTQLMRLLDRQSSEAALSEKGESRQTRNVQKVRGVEDSTESPPTLQEKPAGLSALEKQQLKEESLERASSSRDSLQVAAETRTCERRLARLHAMLAALESEKQNHSTVPRLDSQKPERLRTEDGPELPLLPPLPFSNRIPAEYQEVMNAAERHYVKQPCLKDPFPLHNFAPLHSGNLESAEDTSPPAPCVFSSIPGNPIPQPSSSSDEPRAESQKTSWRSLSGTVPSSARRINSPASESGRSCASSAANSQVRSQWLLQRVSRISRLHGLEQIHQKMQDLSPTLSEISRSARRAMEAEQTRSGAASERSSLGKTEGDSQVSAVTNSQKTETSSSTDTTTEAPERTLSVVLSAV